jgi:hypothetical protein
MKKKKKKILCGIVTILLSTDAAARLCARRALYLAVVFENVGPPLSSVM